MATGIIALFIVLAAGGIAMYIGDYRRDTAVLRHTVETNLGILQRELAEINPLTDSIADEDDRARALAFIASSTASADRLKVAVSGASRSQLTDQLSQVFSAMEDARQARLILIKHDIRSDRHMELN